MAGRIPLGDRLGGQNRSVAPASMRSQPVGQSRKGAFTLIVTLPSQRHPSWPRTTPSGPYGKRRLPFVLPCSAILIRAQLLQSNLYFEGPNLNVSASQIAKKMDDFQIIWTAKLAAFSFFMHGMEINPVPPNCTENHQRVDKSLSYSARTKSSNLITLIDLFKLSKSSEK